MPSKVQQPSLYPFSEAHQNWWIIRTLATTVSLVSVICLALMFGLAGDTQSNVVLALSIIAIFWTIRTLRLQRQVLSQEEAEALMGLARIGLVIDE